MLIKTECDVYSHSSYWRTKKIYIMLSGIIIKVIRRGAQIVARIPGEPFMIAASLAGSCGNCRHQRSSYVQPLPYDAVENMISLHGKHIVLR